MYRKTVALAYGCLLAAVVGCALPGTPITTRSLLAEMTELRGLAEFPSPPFTCAQFSSYDRRSKSPTQPEPPEEGWFANGDFAQFLREEQRDGRTEWVLMDAPGPGAIVRIWSADPKGVLRVYLDSAERPAFEAPMQDLLGGRVVGIPAPLACERSMGWSCYFPIPYAQRCKVTCDVRDFYYHVNYRTYQPGTRVITFTQADLNAIGTHVYDIAGRLGAGAQGGLPDQIAHAPQQTAQQLRAAPRESLEPIALSGPAAIGELAVKLDARDPVQALRHVVLTLDFDGARTVEAPLGDFFGAAPGLNPYESLPLGVRDDGWQWCHWIMPFRHTAVLGFHNLGDQEVTLQVRVQPVAHRWTDRSMYFHAKWRTERDVPTRPMRDWNYLTVHGEGVFVGVALSMANPVRHWWGEGDEKISVDGEAFPSHFGTGTEDYYGYAWCCNRPFAHAYHNQPRCDGPGNYGHTANNRWHILDRIPFKSEFRFDMELWHWHAKTSVTPAVTAYWYARRGASDNFRPLAADDLALTLLPKYVLFTVPGAIEGERMRVIAKRAAARVSPHLTEGASSDECLLYHHDTKLGDKLELGFDVARAGSYQVFARFLRSTDFGIVQMYVNDTPQGDPIDLYSAERGLSDELELGTADLAAGENRLTAELVGTNDRSNKQRYLLALDYIRLEPVP